MAIARQLRQLAGNYTIGLVLFVIPILIGWVGPYLGDMVPLLRRYSVSAERSSISRDDSLGDSADSAPMHEHRN